MIDVLKRLAELDAANPNRPEHVAKSDQNISATLSESTQVAECGMMPEMGAMERPSTPASINMSAGSGQELGDLIKAIATLAGNSKPEMGAPLSSPPTMAAPSQGSIDMRAVLDKLNPMDDDSGDTEMGPPDEERKADEAYDNTPADPTDTNEFDAEQFAHHENPRGADRKGNANNPRAYDTNESIANRLMSEYKQFVGEAKKDDDEDVEEGLKDVAKKVGGAVKKAAGKAMDTLGHGSDEDLIKDLQKKVGVPQTGKKPTNEENTADILTLAGLK